LINKLSTHSTQHNTHQTSSKTNTFDRECEVREGQVLMDVTPSASTSSSPTKKKAAPATAQPAYKSVATISFADEIDNSQYRLIEITPELLKELEDTSEPSQYVVVGLLVVRIVPIVSDWVFVAIAKQQTLHQRTTKR